MRTHFDEDVAIAMYLGGSTQDEVAVEFGVTQKQIYKMLQRRGVKCRKAAKRNQRGSRNHQWKGDSASYKAFHQRLYKLFGKPSYCVVCGTTEAKRFEWANMTGRYSDPSDYKRMCGSCHHKHDGTGRNFLKGAKGGDAA